MDTITTSAPTTHESNLASPAQVAPNRNGYSASLPTVPTDAQHRGSWLFEQSSGAIGNILGLFIARHPEEFQKQQALSIRDGLSAAAMGADNLYQRLARELAGVEGVDFALTVFTNAKSTGNPAKLIASQLTEYALLASAAPKILELAKADLAEKTKVLQVFLKKNAAILAEADDEVDERKAAYQAQIQAEQDAAAAARNAEAKAAPAQQ